MEVVEEKEGPDLTGAEEEVVDAKRFLWLVAAWKHVKEILNAHRLGVGAVQSSSAPQMFSFSLTLSPALTTGWVFPGVYSVSERRLVLHK